MNWIGINRHIRYASFFESPHRGIPKISYFSVFMSMENVAALAVGMDANVISLALRALLAPTVATNVTATMTQVAIRLTDGVNVNPVLLVRAVKNSVPKGIGERIVIVLVNVQIPILYVIQFRDVFAGLDSQVRSRNILS